MVGEEARLAARALQGQALGGERGPRQLANEFSDLKHERGVVSTMSDPEGRRTLSDLVASRPERLFHVGRLDYETEGLMLLMNDGELAHRLAHPRYGVLKTYLADIAGPVLRMNGCNTSLTHF